MLVKRDLTLKIHNFWSSGIYIVLIASMECSVDCISCVDLSVRWLRILAKCLESWYIGAPQNETMGSIGILHLSVTELEASIFSPGFRTTRHRVCKFSTSCQVAVLLFSNMHK